MRSDLGSVCTILVGEGKCSISCEKLKLILFFLLVLVFELLWTAALLTCTIAVLMVCP